MITWQVGVALLVTGVFLGLVLSWLFDWLWHREVKGDARRNEE
jgi:hypothetical protein